MVDLSVLDLAYIGEGFTPADALANARDLARHAEAAGYNRFWLAEHHNLAGIASAATAVCIGHVAGGTSTIRVGAGGITAAILTRRTARTRHATRRTRRRADRTAAPSPPQPEFARGSARTD